MDNGEFKKLCQETLRNLDQTMDHMLFLANQKGITIHDLKNADGTPSLSQILTAQTTVLAQLVDLAMQEGRQFSEDESLITNLRAEVAGHTFDYDAGNETLMCRYKEHDGVDAIDCWKAEVAHWLEDHDV